MGGRRWRLLVGLVAVMLMVAALPAPADDGGPQPRTVVFQASGPGATGNDSQPAVDSNVIRDNALVVWADTRSGTSAIWGRLVTMAGVPLGSDFQISPTADIKAAYDPAVAWSYTSDQYLVVWSYDFDTSDTDIFGQRVRANGTLAGSRISIANPVENQESPDVAYNYWRNQYLVVWADDTNLTSDIMGQRVRGNGNLVGAQIPVATAANGATGHDLSPAVSFNPVKSTYQVVWTDGRFPDFDIFAQRIRGNGNLVGTSFPVTWDTADQYNPDIAFDPYDKEWYVVWSDDRNKSVDIYGQLTSSYSRLRGGQRRIGLGMGNDWDPVVSRSGPGDVNNRYLVAWTDTRFGALDWDIRGRYVSPLGKPQGTADFVIEGTTYNQRMAADIWGRTFP